MPIARFQLPDGRIARFEVPEGTSPEEAHSLIQAHLPTSDQQDVPELPESLRQRPAKEPVAPRELTTWEKVRPYVAPAVEALGAGGGALVGGTAGSVVPGAGTIALGAAGAGLGYGIAKEALEAADVYLGNKAPRQGIAQITEPARNILEGATLEVGGRVISPLLSKAFGVAADVPAHISARFTPQGKAAGIAVNALGPDLPEALNALRAAQGQRISAAQATANINSPTWQALADRVLARDPRFLGALERSQAQESLNALSGLAGGETAAGVRASSEAAKQATREITTPLREKALSQANLGQIKSEKLINELNQLSDKPEFAGNDIISGSIRNIVNDISRWKGSSEPATALDAIRKNSVNAAIAKLRPGMDASSQRNLAAGVLSRIKPVIDDAIEAAGGTGYREYLNEHARLSQKIAEKQLTGEALNLWKTNKDAFVRLVQNESPETVERILGPGKYNIASGLAEDTLGTLQSEASKVIRDANIKSQVEGGQTALKELLLQNMNKFRLPSYLSALISTTNKALNILENKVGRRTMTTLTEALKTPEGARDLLESLPTAEQNRISRLLSDPSGWGVRGKSAITGAAASGVNMLSPEKNIENKLIE